MAKVTLGAALLCVAATAAADSFYCGNRSRRRTCPLPSCWRSAASRRARSTTRKTCTVPSDSGRGTIKRGVTTIERWIYDSGSQRFAMVVTIVNGEIKSIEPIKPL